MSAGGLSPDGTHWVSTKGDDLFPVKVLAKLFRAKLRAALLEGLASGAVTLPTSSAPDVLDELRTALCRTDWVVYAKAPFGGAEQVYAYLGRYTHRVGISNARLRSMDERGVTFATKGGGQCTLPGVEFLRRFVDHVLPKGFTRIRHYGLLAPCHATTTLERARVLLTPKPTTTTTITTTPKPTAVGPGATVPSVEGAPPTWVRAAAGMDRHRCRSMRAMRRGTPGATAARRTTDAVVLGHFVKARVRTTGTPSGARVRGARCTGARAACAAATHRLHGGSRVTHPEPSRGRADRARSLVARPNAPPRMHARADGQPSSHIDD